MVDDEARQLAEQILEGFESIREKLSPSDLDKETYLAVGYSKLIVRKAVLPTKSGLKVMALGQARIIELSQRK